MAQLRGDRAREVVVVIAGVYLPVLAAMMSACLSCRTSTPGLAGMYSYGPFCWPQVQVK